MMLDFYGKLFLFNFVNEVKVNNYVIIILIIYDLDEVMYVD